MSEILNYLTEKVPTPTEWLNRKPRDTHPAILAAVREALATGLHYNDDVERHVADVAGDLPLSSSAVGRQLGSEVYLARCILRDETALADQERLLAAGFMPIDDVEICPGGRYEICQGVIYSGYQVPQYSPPQPVRAHVSGVRILFLPKGARTKGYAANHLTLIKPINKTRTSAK